MTAPLMIPEAIDVVFSFDTTGSMYPCLTQVRRNIAETVERLFRDIPNLHVGIIAHGDYCDGNEVITKLDLTDDRARICDFVNTVKSTWGGDAPEAYELVLHESRSLSWRAGKAKVLVMIGDDVPHGPSYLQNVKNLDWRNELKLLIEGGINVYAVQALGRRHALPFYTEMAKITGGFKLDLYQFSAVRDLVMAVCYRQDGAAALQRYETEVQSSGRMTDTTGAMFDTLAGREVRPIHRARERAVRGPSSTPSASLLRIRVAVGSVDPSELTPVHPSRFQILDIDAKVAIKGFVQDNGLIFTKGKGFYQFTKTVTVQPYKEVVLVENATGAMYSGSTARSLLGLSTDGSGGNVRLRPGSLPGYTAYIQSTSVNRKLLAGTKFLYEVQDWAEAA